ncbi:MAG: N-acetyltransferase [Proteobacteria bacterium]|nr:MAG: N-acetyltransferase [Pseudomonadota bacterium]
MDLTFEMVKLPQAEMALRHFLLGEPWPFHVNATISEEKLAAMISSGVFAGVNARSFFIQSENTTLGFIRLFDLDDIEDGGFPMFDLRVSTKYRGRGVGAEALTWLSQYAFSEFPELDRIVGATRADNVAMRKTFRKCGYVKEAHFRNDWETADGKFIDTVRYSLLKVDWMLGTTTPILWNDEPI